MSIAIWLSAALVLPLAEGEALKVADPVPSLAGANWLQGEKVEAYQKGHVYVLDFWATWCGPCVAAIPHMIELQAKYLESDVHVVGVAIWPRKGMTPTAQYVKDRGDMTYRIAEDVDDALAARFMKAAGQGGIPCCMVVGKTGQLEWIGHPMDGLGEVLAKVVADEFDAKAFAAQQAVIRARKNALLGELRTAQKEKDWRCVIDVVKKLQEVDAEGFAGLVTLRYVALAKLGEKENARHLGQALIQEHLQNAGMLNSLAWTIVDPEGALSADEIDRDLALQAIQQAMILTEHKDAAILDTAARCHFLKGDIARAIQLQKAAISNAGSERFAEQLQPALREYEEAARGEQ